MVRHPSTASPVAGDRAGEPGRVSVRRVLFYAAATALVVLCAVISHFDWGYEHPVHRTVGFALLVPIGIAVTLLWPREQSRRAQIVTLLLLALAARLALLPNRADSDVNRYLWEGHLVRAGESPYAHVAAAPEWEHLRDRYWPGMNQKDLTTIYPPLAQWTFAAVGGLWYRPVALKLLFIAFDIGVVALLAALLAARALPLRLAGLYAFNPVPLIGFAGEGHFDPMLLFFVLLAIWLREHGRVKWSWIALGYAVQMKLVAVALMPLFARRGGWRTGWVAALVIALPFLPYLADVRGWIEGVRHFGGEFAFNGSVHALLWRVLGDLRVAATVCGALFAAWVAMVAWFHDDLARAAFWVFGGLVILSPTVHYWYVAWALVFVPLFPSGAWLVLSGVMALYFLVRSSVLAGLLWGSPPWAQITIWSLFGVALLRDAVVSLRPFLRRRAEAAGTVRTLAVVIPVLNEEKNIRRSLDSVAQMMPPPEEVIVVDGGSTDATRKIATECGATIVLTASGRGRQIAAGAAASCSDAVLILHADSIVARDTSRRVLAALNANPAALGGAVGQKFDGDSTKLMVVEVLNEIRALFLGVPFGDQGQFFRRAALKSAGGFPMLPLMEDVEFSLRIRALGPVLYLGGGIVSSDRRWQAESWWRRCVKVITMTIHYRMKRRVGDRLASEFYRRYYPGRLN